MNKTKRLGREAALWAGGVLGSLCLLSLLAGWALNVTPLVFASGSMSPSYDAGSLGLAREVPAADLRVGDVVSVINAEGDRVTHRIVGLSPADQGAVLTLQGDSNNVPDAEAYAVTSADRVFAGVPYVGYALNAAASPVGLALGVLLVAGSLWLGFGRRNDDATSSARTRTLVSTGVAGVVVAGTLLGASGQAPWAFTSALWTDSATATTTASAPAGDTTPPSLTNPLPADGTTAANWAGLDCADSGVALSQLCVNATDADSVISSVTVKLVRTSGPAKCWDGANFVDGTGCAPRVMTGTGLAAPQYRTTGLTAAQMVVGTYTATYVATDAAGNTFSLVTSFRIGAAVPAMPNPCSNPTGNSLTINWTYGPPNPTVGFELRTNKSGGSTQSIAASLRSYTGNFQNYNAEIWVVANNGGVYSADSPHYYVTGTGSGKTCTLVP